MMWRRATKGTAGTLSGRQVEPQGPHLCSTAVPAPTREPDRFGSRKGTYGRVLKLFGYFRKVL